eukprot:gnl/Carplike_NY0171/2044_a2752_552.p1 GENE.gnl/Carplike_NY0171/2044_a2752_552~~gnl/Carplike_NY0171/2044_a2752_552.p1  ORF type:complete len:1354 (+),score=423.38 gnl/Carplike_NY0171/2044_a2752_552:1862-5923(+)
MLQMIVQLQQHVNSLIDSTQGPPTGGRTAAPGIKQLLDKKTGLLRQNMMGKRVNYAARSVISPDPNIGANEIGVPLRFAKTLTFPEPVTSHNVDELRRLVINGSDTYPGANVIEDELGRKKDLSLLNKEIREKLAENLLSPSPAVVAKGKGDVPKIVYRHMNNNDYVLMNRQPTLHKASIMAHRVHVLPQQRTLRFHYCNCASYNADFDGDEMNMHLPQTHQAMAEARFIMSNNEMYVTPTAGSPIRGLIQDHVVAGTLLTKKDTFLSREKFMQLCYIACQNVNPSEVQGTIPVNEVPPAIMYPQPLYTGKQVISVLLLYITKGRNSDFNMVSRNKVRPVEWGLSNSDPEGSVLIRKCHLLAGLIEKSQLAAATGGLVHSIQELYGGATANNLLTSLARLGTSYIQMHGHTCSLEDLVLLETTERHRHTMLKASERWNAEREKTISSILDVSEEFTKFVDTLPTSLAREEAYRRAVKERMATDSLLDQKLDNAYSEMTNGVTTKVIGEVYPKGLIRPFPKNCFSLMIVTGAKGSKVNFSQITCCLGQQSLEGRRVPIMPSGRTMPSYLPYDQNPISGGYISDRFLSGLRPQSYYFHCMAGREGLVDTAVKTATSGYLQRCLIKGLESVHVAYDATVRDEQGLLVQVRYGGDSLDTTKQGFLTNFDFLSENFGRVTEQLNPDSALGSLDTSSASEYQKEMKAILKAIEKKEKKDKKDRKKGKPVEDNGVVVRYPDPVLEFLNPQSCLGAVSESYEKKLNEWIKENKKKLASLSIDRKVFKAVMLLKYLRSTIQPGEAVGVVAAESVGEPSTQLTLNTFHLAGHGAANVTLGIPRLNEIVKSLSEDIKTPSMQLPLLPHVDPSLAPKLAGYLGTISLRGLLHGLHVTEYLSLDPIDNVSIASRKESANPIRVYECGLVFESLKKLKEKGVGVTPMQLRAGLIIRFLSLLQKTVLKEVRQSGKHASSMISTHSGVNDEVEEEKERELKEGTNNAELEEDPAKRKEAKKSSERRALRAYGADEVSESVSMSREKGISITDEETTATALLSQASDQKDEEEEDENDGKDEESDDEDKTGVLTNPSSSIGATVSIYHTLKQLQVLPIESFLKSERIEKTEEELEAEWAQDITPSEQKCIETRLKSIHDVKFIMQDGVPIATFKLCMRANVDKLLMTSIVENVVEQVSIRKVPGLSRCFSLAQHMHPFDSSKKQAVLQTEGSSIDSIWEIGDEVLDLNRIYTNNCIEMIRKYGVEAGRALMVMEIGSIFSTYSISVDHRHLSLIGDKMTINGHVVPFTRQGARFSPSPLFKMSFETTTNFLVHAATRGSTDTVETPSASIVMGQPPRIGTNAFRLFATCG